VVPEPDGLPESGKLLADKGGLIMYFVKLFNIFLTSTINEQAYHIRLVWITCLLLADKNGNFRTTPQALARRANVTVEEAEEALDHLLSPDRFSSSPEAEGRRLERVSQNEWTITNFKKYKLMKDPDEQREQEAEKKRRYRAKKKERESSGHEVDNGGHEVDKRDCPPLSPNVHPIEIEKENYPLTRTWNGYEEREEVENSVEETPVPVFHTPEDEHEVINQLLDTYDDFVTQLGDPGGKFKGRFPGMLNSNLYEDTCDALEYIACQLLVAGRDPRAFMAFIFEQDENFDKISLQHTEKGDLSRLKGCGYPSVKKIVADYRVLLEQFLAIPREEYQPSFFRLPEVANA